MRSVCSYSESLPIGSTFSIPFGCSPRLAVNLCDQWEERKGGGAEGTHAKLDGDGEEVELLADLGGEGRVALGVDVRRLDDARLALVRGADEPVDKLVPGCAAPLGVSRSLLVARGTEAGRTVSHGERGGSGTGLGGDDLVASELDAVDERLELLLVLEEALRERGRRLREKGQDCRSGVTSDAVPVDDVSVEWRGSRNGNGTNTGTVYSGAVVGAPIACALMVEARTTSRVVTPKRLVDQKRISQNALGGRCELETNRLGSKTPAALRTSAVTGTCEDGCEFRRAKWGSERAHGRVDRVRDDADEGLGAALGDGGRDVADLRGRLPSVLCLNVTTR